MVSSSVRQAVVHKRARNKQGTGNRLRDDILAAASRILAETGSEDALTLRAIAREAGITAPAIYAHFADLKAIRLTVIEQTFAQLATSLTAAADTVAGDPVAALRTVCLAYLDFAREKPHHYRLLFERHRADQGADVEQAPDVQSIYGADAFGVLLRAVADCIAAGASSATEPAVVATRVWIGLHGQATLQASLPWFPWPPAEQLAGEVLTRLADLA